MKSRLRGLYIFIYNDIIFRSLYCLYAFLVSSPNYEFINFKLFMIFFIPANQWIIAPIVIFQNLYFLSYDTKLATYRVQQLTARRKFGHFTDIFVLSQMLFTLAATIATFYCRTKAELNLLSEIFPGFAFVLSSVSITTAIAAHLCIFNYHLLMAAVLIVVSVHASAGNLLVAYMLANYITTDFLSIYFDHSVIIFLYLGELILALIQALDAVLLYLRHAHFLRQQLQRELWRRQKLKHSVWEETSGFLP